ncbi:MAG: hypothetical protein LAN64_10600 [Acidobacteriia bacterium]|nr:hypothetical protein [Terriglobia bacterium]
MTNYGKFAITLIAAWFLASLAASAAHLFESDSAQLAFPVAIAALTPLVLFGVWFAISPGFQRFTRSLDPRLLTIVQTWRIGGLVFVVLYAFGLLPGVFALPAGWGDFAIGVTAPWIAWRLASPGHRIGFILWQVLGMIDLVNAVSLGTTARLISPSAPSMQPLTVLPLSMIPTFVVPLLLIFHFICIAQARQWQADRNSAAGRQLQSSAA